MIKYVMANCAQIIEPSITSPVDCFLSLGLKFGACHKNHNHKCID